MTDHIAERTALVRTSIKSATAALIALSASFCYVKVEMEKFKTQLMIEKEKIGIEKMVEKEKINIIKNHYNIIEKEDHALKLRNKRAIRQIQRRQTANRSK